jgi:DNA polymerase-3 subunit alpha
VAQRITDKDQEGAEALLVKLKEEFGEDLYVELQPHDFDKQRIVNPILIKWAQKYDLPLLVATDAHYLEPEDIKYHKALKAIVFQSTMEKSGFSIDSNYVMDSEDLMQRCAKMDISEHIVRKAFDNSKRVAQQCKARLEPFKDALPKFQVEK